MKSFLIFCLLFAASTVLAQNSTSKVGMTTRMLTDTTRKNWAGTAPRPILTMVWYPADTSAAEEPVVMGPPGKTIFLAGKAAKEAKILADGKRYPLIILSHGTGGSALQLMWLGEYLASHGHIVAAANHHGNTGAEDKAVAQGTMLWWERSLDVKVIIDKMLTDAEFGGRIDKNKIGIAGFSIGGATVISVAGGIFDSKNYDKFCQSPQRDKTCESQPELPTAKEDFEKIRNTDPLVIESLKRMSNSYQDKRVKAVFAIAPALGSAFTAENLAPIKVPVEIVVGEGDTTTQASTNARPFAKNIKGATLTIIPGNAAHYTFLSDCSDTGKELAPLLCRDGEGVDRTAVHREVSEMALKFFRKKL